MKRKNEEQLIELAFGDLNAADAERLRQEIASDPQACETLRTYEDLRSSLGGMRDVPEMQMSRERLRHAILAGGLKESRRWSLQWLGAPVALAAVAFAFTLVARRPALPLPPGQGLVATQGQGDIEIRGFDPTLSRIEAPSTMFGSPELNAATFNEDSKPTPVKAPKHVRVASMSKPKPKVDPVVPGAAGGNAPAGVSADLTPAAMSATLPTDPALDTHTEAGEAEIIVLTTETHRETGAQRATAMESGNNVLIGG